MHSGSVLHVTSLPGGGVDRHIRDIARTVARHHLIWHTAATADVIEMKHKMATLLSWNCFCQEVPALTPKTRKDKQSIRRRSTTTNWQPLT